MINHPLYEVVREMCREIIAEFEADATDVHSHAFLSKFSYLFLTQGQEERKKRVLDAALAPQHKQQAEETIEATYSDHGGGTFEFYVANAVEDFLNYVIPRIIGLPDRDTVFDSMYEQFDSSFYGDKCVVTTLAVLSNVWDNAGQAVLPPGYSLRYYDRLLNGRAPDRWTRDRSVPFFEISQTAQPTGLGRSIRDESAYFVFSHSTALPKNKKFLTAAYAVRDEITRKFIMAVRLLKSSAAFSDYRGFRTIGHLALYRMNMMNFPEEFVERGLSLELNEYDGHRLRRLLPKLANKPFGSLTVIDTKIEDALRRKRQGAGLDNNLEIRAAIDQLLDYFQILEAVVPAVGSEFIALYAAVLIHAVNQHEDTSNAFDFVKRMHKVRNEVMHGRLDDVLTATKNKFTVQDAERFRAVVHALAGAHLMNGSLRDVATQLALGKKPALISMSPESVEEMNAMRRPQQHPPTWW